MIYYKKITAALLRSLTVLILPLQLLFPAWGMTIVHFMEESLRERERERERERFRII